MRYKLWKFTETIKDFIDPERSIPNDAPYYKTDSHIDWVESKGKYGCPGAVSAQCAYFKRGCRASKCEHSPPEYRQDGGWRTL